MLTIMLIPVQIFAVFLIWRFGIRAGYSLARYRYHRCNTIHLLDANRVATSDEVARWWDDHEPPLFSLRDL